MNKLWLFSVGSHKLILLGLIVLVLTLTNIPNAAVQTAAGNLDPTFGSGGKVISALTTFGDYAYAAALQPDGKIVAAGYSDWNRGVLVSRYLNDGRLDTSFGDSGKVLTNFLDTFDSAYAVAIQSDGKIIAAGQTYNYGKQDDFALVRYTANGDLDTTFGEGGKVITDFASSYDTIYDIAIQPDGKIIAAGLADVSPHVGFALSRYNSDGSLDQTFGSGGKVFTSFATGEAVPFSVTLQADNKIVAAGQVFDARTGLDFALARYNADGSLDAGFGNGGKVTTAFSSRIDGSMANQYQDFIADIQIQPDGKIVAAGSSVYYFYVGHSDIALARYNGDGSLDSTFGVGGKVTTDFSGQDEAAKSVALQSNGRIVVGGNTSADSQNSPLYDFALVRYNPNGNLDFGFGRGGRVVTDFSGDFDSANKVLIQRDGRIIAAGATSKPNESAYPDFALARYNGDLTFDFCIQDDSNGNLLQINTTTGDYQFTNCSGLTIGGTGTLTKRGNQITLQHNASDRRMMAKIDTSTNKAIASIQLLSQGRTFSITDRNITNNTCTCR